MTSVPPAFASLDSLHRDVLVVLALDAERPRSRSHWQERTAAAGVVDDRGRKLHGPGFKAIVDALTAVGAAVLDARNEYVFASEWLVPLLQDAQQRRRVAAIAQGLAPARREFFSSRSGIRGPLLAALVAGDAAAVLRAESAFNAYPYSSARERDSSNGLVRVLGLAPPLEWVMALEPTLRLRYLKDAVRFAFEDVRRLGPGPHEAAMISGDDPLRAQVAMLLAVAGEGDRARAVLGENDKAPSIRAALGFIALTEARFADARSLFVAAGVGRRGRRVDVPGDLAIFDILLAVTSDRVEELGDVPRRMEASARQLARHVGAMNALATLSAFRRAEKYDPQRRPSQSWLDAVVIALVETWMGGELSGRSRLVDWGSRARSSGYVWLADEIERIASRASAGSLVSLFETKAAWELVLDSLQGALVQLATPEPPPRAKPDAELWWTVDVAPESHEVAVEASLVTKRSPQGTRVSFGRLLDDDTLGIGAQDRRIAEVLNAGRDRHRRHSTLSVLLMFVGHPRVRNELGGPVRVETGEPRLRVDAIPKGARVRLVPSAFDHAGISVERDGNERIIVHRLTPIAARIVAVLPDEGLEVPKNGLARMSEMLASMGGAIGVEMAPALARESRGADPRIHVQMFRPGSGLRARLRVLPAGVDGPALRPGVPPVETVTHVEGKLVRIARDLGEEQRRLELVLDHCPTLASLPQDGDDRIARELETCLELLLELRVEAADIVVDWLEGQPMRVPVVRSAEHVRIQVNGDSSWLSMHGDVHVDGDRVIEMRELLEAASRARGRFIPIGEDEYLALTEDVRSKLEALGRMQGLGKDGRVSVALLSAMEGVCDGLSVSFSDAVATKRASLEEARDLVVPTPRGLAAELRDYQRDGFLFLARRSAAGFGACLADDMGLGKTVQALALLLHRSKSGPALVVAPTSVCRNWEDEARRFAPTLSIRRLRDGDRASCIADAKAGDVVITSYGLLVAEAELLASRSWGTVVYDEAHALKNASTRRWSAAREMKSSASIALTGTPIENHAGEIHALLDLLVPGMLGSRATFDRVFGAPIADGNQFAATLLRQLVRPFIVRRTKAQVLSELPPKTEVVHRVAASPEHLAFYEAVRLRAIEKIQAAKEAGGARAARARMDLLAEITRLRRAAIDPRLVGGDEAPPGGKFDLLFELVSELRAEGRRALVFSQFLEVLDLARARLEEGGIECLRLDGTMTEGVRAEAVAAFQSGRADVFLVSLKAGGVGMNLTAADFVILLDPWWNPAVEDQAAGRAHRIGQSRAVTVARIVTEQTIEEKVLALHAKKRKLYEDVIADADGTSTLDVETIAALLDRDDGAPSRRASRGEQGETEQEVPTR